MDIIELLMQQALKKLGNKNGGILKTLGDGSTPDSSEPSGNGGSTNFANNLNNEPLQLYQDALRQQGVSDEVINGVGQGLNYGNKDIADWQNQYNNGIGRNNPINIPKTQEEIELAKQGQFNVPNVYQAQVTDKSGFNLANGLNDIKQGYFENLNNGWSTENWGKKQDLQSFKNSINPNDYTTALTSDEQIKFNQWADTMKKQGLINPNDNFNDYDMQGYWKNEVLNNTNLANGNAQNHFTDKYKKPNHATFSDESMYATGDNKKYAGHWNNNEFIAPANNNKMTKIGEFAGTINRITKNPITQGILSGAVGTVLTGNPLFGVMLGTGVSNAKQMSKIYQEALKKHGVDIGDLGSFGAVSPKTFSTLMQPEYKEALNNTALAKLEETKLWHELMSQYKQKELDIKQQNANTNKYKAEQSANGKGVSKGNSIASEKATQSYANDLAEYYNIYQSGNISKINYAKQQFLKRHKGINPDKELGL